MPVALHDAAGAALPAVCVAKYIGRARAGHVELCQLQLAIDVWLVVLVDPASEQSPQSSPQASASATIWMRSSRVVSAIFVLLVMRASLGPCPSMAPWAWEVAAREALPMLLASFSLEATEAECDSLPLSCLVRLGILCNAARMPLR